MSSNSDIPRERPSERFYEAVRRAMMPELRNSQYDYAARLRELSRHAGRWLDVGCGHHVVPDWAAGSTNDLAPHAGLDPDFSALRMNRRVRWRITGQGESLPFAAASFDLVSANMVLEHVAVPQQLFAEVRRVLRPGGRFLVHTPNLHGYSTALTRLVPETLRAPLAAALHDRKGADVYPTYYRANSQATLQQLAREAGFHDSRVTYVHSSPQLVRIPPLLLVEMLMLRAFSTQALQGFRSCLIAVSEVER